MIQRTFLAGLAGTAAMTAVMLMAPWMGMPKMNAAGLLSMMLGLPLIVGWLMHFMIGIVFALAYALFFQRIVQGIGSAALRGVLFGLAVFLFAQMAMALMGAMMGSTPPMEGSKALMLMGSIMGHVVFGIVVALLVSPAVRPKAV